GHEVLVVTPGHSRAWPRRERREGIDIVRVGGMYRRGERLRIGRLAMWAVLPRVFAVLWGERDHYDVLHVAQFSALAAPCALIARLTGKPLVISVQSAGPDERMRERLRQPTLSLLSGEGGDSLICDVRSARVQVDDITWLRQGLIG